MSTLPQGLQGKKVLIVDDEPTMRDVLSLLFQSEGYQVYKAINGAETLRQLYVHHPDLILLDVMMPGRDGLAIFADIRQLTDVPVIFVSALGDEDDVVRGLESGASDYVVKPFHGREILARARNVLRQHSSSTKEETVAYSDSYLTIDLQQRRVWVQGQPVKLSDIEHRLLSCLVENAGRILTYRQILNYVWGWDYDDKTENVHVYIARLRQKLERDPKNPHYVQTEYGVGCRFEVV